MKKTIKTFLFIMRNGRMRLGLVKRIAHRREARRLLRRQEIAAHLEDRSWATPKRKFTDSRIGSKREDEKLMEIYHQLYPDSTNWLSSSSEDFRRHYTANKLKSIDLSRLALDGLMGSVLDSIKNEL